MVSAGPKCLEPCPQHLIDRAQAGFKRLSVRSMTHELQMTRILMNSGKQWKTLENSGKLSGTPPAFVDDFAKRHPLAADFKSFRIVASHAKLTHRRDNWSCPAIR